MHNISLENQMHKLPKHLQKEVEKFIHFLLYKEGHNTSSLSSETKRQAGFAKGKIKMMSDFDEPLDDFKDYI